MVIPWMGIPLASIVARLEPTSTARFIEFTTILDPKQMSGQRANILLWPYVEALRMDEAMNPLTLMGTGVYGKPLLPQNGAPLRLVAPWKYGFKGGKSVVNIRFTETQPGTTWNIAVPNEYGFYANVNPEVDHPVQHIPAADPARGHVDRRDDPAAGWQAVAGGGRRWQRLHRLVYAAAILGVLHFLWLVKRDVTLPRYFLAVLVLRLAERFIRQRRTEAASAALAGR